MDGTITISRNSRNTIEVHLTDNASRQRFLEVAMTPEALGFALTGLGFQPCVFELHAENIGKVRETKTERVPFAYQYGAHKDEQAKQAALAPFEGDGWKGYVEDLGNHHKGNSEKGYMVTFTRFVEKEDSK